jgi:exodeoxyribonuclease VII small subunit
MARKKFKFEDGISRLEEIVEKLENDEVELEKAIALFEEGMGISQTCMKILDEAQQKIEFLIPLPLKMELQVFLLEPP